MIYDAGIEKKVNELLKEADNKSFEEAINILDEAYNTVKEVPYEKEFDVALAKTKFQLTYLKKIVDAYHKKCVGIDVPSISTGQINKIEEIWNKADEMESKEEQNHTDLLDYAREAKKLLYDNLPDSVQKLIDLYISATKKLGETITGLEETVKELEEREEKTEDIQEKIVDELN